MSYSFLDFRSDEIKHLSSMVLTYTSAQREYSHNTDYARAVKRCSSSCLLGWPESIVSEDGLGSTGGRECCEMTRNTKKILGRHRAISWGPCRIFEIFWRKRGEIYSQIQRNYAWYLAIPRRRRNNCVLDSTRGKQGSQVFRRSGNADQRVVL
ncbi:CBM_collapsed_G0046750.mRNA.1.CDS.1 [Saccharomyces cerevisiae]|nr:CBM_collapsed_G0046750.mRNA.1.CDS.1 [Saccharomyces cerevisiae]